MKTLNLLSVGIIITSLSASVSYARTSSIRGRFDHSMRKPVLTDVKWTGTFRCEEKKHAVDHEKNHECDLEFVNDDTNEVWNVKTTKALESMHQQYDGPIKAQIEAVRSPRYLLGGSYVDIKNIKLMDGAVKDDKLPESKDNEKMRNGRI